MYTMIICHWAILHYNMSFQTIPGRSDGVFRWFPALSEDQEKNCRIHQNYLVAFTLSDLACHPQVWLKGLKMKSLRRCYPSSERMDQSDACKHYFGIRLCVRAKLVSEQSHFKFQGRRDSDFGPANGIPYL